MLGKEKPLVLAACSDEELGWRLERWLLENGFRCEVFDSCARLLARLLEQNASLLIVDWNTDGMPPSHLRAVLERSHPQLPVIWLHGPETEPPKELFHSLSEVLLPKPVERRQLVESALVLLEQSERPEAALA